MMQAGSDCLLLSKLILESDEESFNSPVNVARVITS